MSDQRSTALVALLVCAGACDILPSPTSPTDTRSDPDASASRSPHAQEARRRECRGLDEDGDGIPDDDVRECPRRYDCLAPERCVCASTHRLCDVRCVHMSNRLAMCNGSCRELDSDPNHCGSCGSSCRNGDLCSEGVCRCASEFHARCGVQCTPIANDPANCGACGNRCEEGFVCRGGRCLCVSPFVFFEGRCVWPNTAGSCGSSGVRCPSGTVCLNGSCGCLAMCQAVCTDTRSDRRHCGACEHACLQGEDCVASECTCAAPRTSCPAGCFDLGDDRAHCGSCGVACAASASCREGVCRLRIGAPSVGERVSARRPTLRWPGGLEAAEICADRACTRVTESVTASSSGTATVSRPLAPGVHFWRVRGTGTRSGDSPVVAFRIDHRATTRLGLLPPSPDLNNDGLADVVAATDSTVAVFLGATPSLAPTPDRQVGVGELGPPLALSAAGDTNDDAFGDVLVTTMHLPDGMLLGASSAASVSLSWRNHLGVDPVPLLDVNGDGVLDEIIDLEGRAHFVFGDRIEDRLSLVSVDRTASRLRGAAPVGDVNGDGYRDVIVATEADGALRVRVFLGSATGLDRSLEASPPDGASFRSGVASAGDVNGDGLADVMVELAPSHVALYLGGSEALALHRELHPSQGDWLRVYAAGDVDGDGFGDLATLEAGSDRIRWLRGAASGLTNTPTTLVDARWSAVDAIGVPRDVDGDGFDDLVLAAPSRGVVYVLHGASTGSLNRVDTLNVAEAPAPTLRVL